MKTIIILLIFNVSVIAAQSWYVSTSGTSTANGSRTSPLDLTTAVSENSPAMPGDTIYLLPGTYLGNYEIVLNGKEGLPIQIRPATEARTTLDGRLDTEKQALYIKSSWIEIYDLEITNSEPNRSLKSDGVRFDGSNSKLINCIIHNNAQGVGFWSNAINSELYGNIIFNNGYEASDRGHGHGIYTQNKEGTKQIRDNILFFGYGFGIHAYTESGALEGFSISRNVWFRTGNAVAGSSLEGEADGLLIGGLQPVDRSIIEENYSWVPAPESRSLRLGWGSSIQNKFIELRNNYLLGIVATQGAWESAIVENNEFFSTTISPDPNEFPNNRYSSILPTTNKIIIHRNEYSPNRSRIIIYNWENKPCQELLLTDYLNPTDSFSIYSVYTPFGPPLISELYKGEPICVPMNSISAPQPQSAPEAITGVDDPLSLFGVFLLKNHSQKSMASLKRKKNAPLFVIQKIGSNTIQINSTSPIIEIKTYDLNGSIINTSSQQESKIVLIQKNTLQPMLVYIRTKKGSNYSLVY